VSEGRWKKESNAKKGLIVKLVKEKHSRLLIGNVNWTQKGFVAACLVVKYEL
jgi:hypothetical protein